MSTFAELADKLDACKGNIRLETMTVPFELIEAVAAALRSVDGPRCADVIGCSQGQPCLQEQVGVLWVQNGKIVNAFTWSKTLDPAKWDHDGYWRAKGYTREPMYAAVQRAITSKGAA